MKLYHVLIHSEAFRKAETYLGLIKSSGSSPAGDYLRSRLEEKDLSQISVEEFIEIIISTKRPHIFAESAVYGNSTDWNLHELSILGDIGIAVSVLVYDNGMHVNPRVHDEPFPAVLLYTPGALLRNGKGHIPADWNEAVRNRHVYTAGYRRLYERRLLPLFLHANEVAASVGKKAFITIPGLGCGQFAGPFAGIMGEHLKLALMDILSKHACELACVSAVYYDPFNECVNERLQIDHLLFMVRPLTHGNHDKPQLCRPEFFNEQGDDFSGCLLFSIAAWDHVSWPGNDFYAGSRATDDGVKVAATSSMHSLTGIKGFYDRAANRYNPPSGYRNWEDVVVKHDVSIAVKGNISVLPAV